MKAKILIPLIVLLSLTVFIGNWIYGNVYAKRLDDYLSDIPSSKFNYEVVKVNPLWSIITFKNFSYSDQGSSNTFQSAVVRLTMKHAEAFKIAKTKKIEQLSKLQLEFIDFKVSQQGELVFSGENMLIDFSGNLNQQKLNDINKQFPDENQELSFLIKDVEVYKEMFGNNLCGNICSSFNDIQSAKIKISFTPNKKELDVEHISIKTKALSLIGETEITYTGNGVDDFSVSKADVDCNLELTKKVNWNGGSADSKYSVGSLDSSFKGGIEFNANGEVVTPLSGASFSLNMKDFTVDYQGYEKERVRMQLSMLGIDVNELLVSELSVNARMNNGELLFDNTNFVSPLLEASLKGKIKYDKNHPGKSDLENIKMQIGNIKPKLKNALETLEKSFGIVIPKEGDDFVLEVKGKLDKPQIKGIHY